jgi:hypothetical protein
MSKANIEVCVDLSELAYGLAQTVHERDLLAFILDVDANLADLQFTKRLSAALIDVIKEEEAE